MKVTREEMELLQTILEVGHLYDGPCPCEPYGEAIKLANLWRSRGVKSSEFQVVTEPEQKKSPLALSSSGPPSLSLHSLSSSVTPSLSTPPKGIVRGLFSKKTKKQLTVDFVLAAVPPDLTLRSGCFLKAWHRWVENRLELRNATLRAFSQHMNTCARLGESRAIAAIEHSIANSYRAIFEPYPARSAKPDNRDKVGASL